MTTEKYELCPPTWEAAVNIYIMTLTSGENPKAIKSAKADLLNLARWADKTIVAFNQAKMKENS